MSYNLGLLQAIDDRLVCFDGHRVVNLAGGTARDVLAETASLRAAGWIRLDDTDVLGSYYYELTDAGRAVLAAIGGAR